MHPTCLVLLKNLRIIPLGLARKTLKALRNRMRPVIEFNAVEF